MTKWAGSSCFRKGEKCTFSIASGPDGPFDGRRHRDYYNGTIIQGNGNKYEGIYYMYKVKDTTGQIHNVLGSDIWSQFKELIPLAISIRTRISRRKDYE